MPGGAAQIHEAAFGQHVDRVAGGEGVGVVTGLDVNMLHAGRVLEAIDLDFVIEMADVTHDGLILHRLHVLQGDDVFVARGGNVDVGLAEGALDGVHLKPFHRALERVDRVDFGDNHASTKALEREGGALAHVAIAGHESALAGDHDIGGALQTVGQRLAATVEVVELRLGHGVVHVDRGHE